MSESHDEIPFFKPWIGEREESLLMQALQSGWLTSGPFVKQFELGFADAVGAKHAVAVNSCTAAMHIALRAWGIGPDDEVIVPTMTFASAAEVVLHLGARPVLVDVRPEDLTIDPEAVRDAITDRTRAVMPMHYAGTPCRMDELMSIALEHSLVVIDDAAHAFPARYHDDNVGSLTDATCFSFYANKTMTTGEGGMITTDDGDRAELMRSLSLHGLSRGAWTRFTSRGSWDYDIELLGHKYNMSDLAAAVGVGQLERADQLRDLRQRLVERYDERLAGLGWLRPLHRPDDVTSAHHLYVVALDPSLGRSARDDLIAALRSHGIATSVHYRPLHEHSAIRRLCPTDPDDLPVASDLGNRIVSLPLYPQLGTAEVDAVCAAITGWQARLSA